MDIYKKIKPESSEKTLVLVGRIATGVVVVCGILWIPLMKYISGELYHYLQSVQSYIAPPIAAVFLLGLFWKRINSSGALTALIGGFGIGMLRLIAELNKERLSGWLHTFADINFLYFCVYLFLVCIALMILVSLFTRPPTYEKIQGLTYGTTVAEDKRFIETAKDGPYNLTLYSYDVYGNQLEKAFYDTNSYTYDEFEHVIPDSIPPEISNALVNGQPSITVLAGTNATLTLYSSSTLPPAKMYPTFLSASEALIVSMKTGPFTVAKALVSIPRLPALLSSALQSRPPSREVVCVSGCATTLTSKYCFFETPAGGMKG